MKSFARQPTFGGCWKVEGSERRISNFDVYGLIQTLRNTPRLRSRIVLPEYLATFWAILAG